MKNYYIKLTVEDPYPKAYETRVGATSMHTAVARGIKWLREEHWKARPLKKLKIDIQLLQINKPQNNEEGNKNN